MVPFGKLRVNYRLIKSAAEGKKGFVIRLFENLFLDS